MTKDHEQAWAALMRSANRGDANAYTLLLQTLAQAFRAIAAAGLTRLGLPIAEAEDVVQEALIAVHSKRHTWDEGRPMLPWVRAIARHKLLDHARAHRQSRADVSVDAVADKLAAPEPDVNVVLPIDRYLTGLTKRQREVVEALALRGITVREAARDLGMTEGAVRIALHRALVSISARFGHAAA